MSLDALHIGAVVTGPLLPEPVEILGLTPLGTSVKLIGRGLKTNQVHTPVLRQEQVAELVISPAQRPSFGEGRRSSVGSRGTASAHRQMAT